MALALLAGLPGVRSGRLALFALPGAWLAGGLVGLAVPTIGAAPALTAVSFLALGGLVAADARLGPAWVAGLALALGLGHGYLNGSAMSETRLGALGLVGIVTTLFVIVALAAALVVVLRVPSARVAVRVAGSWIAAAGLLIGWFLRPEKKRTRHRPAVPGRKARPADKAVALLRRPPERRLTQRLNGRRRSRPLPPRPRVALRFASARGLRPLLLHTSRCVIIRRRGGTHGDEPGARR